MAKSAGVWIDHRKAVVVSMIEDHESIETVESDVERQPTNMTGGRGPSSGNPTRIPEPEKERNFQQHVKKFYQDVEPRLDGANSIVIFGPGPAKTEFKKHLENNKRFSDVDIQTDTADNMSDEDIKRKTREYFLGSKRH